MMSQATRAVEAPSAAVPVEELQRQVDRGSLFTHTALGESFTRLGETETLLHGLADLLLEKGIVSEDELAAAATRVRGELVERGELAGPGVVVRVDPRRDAAPAPVQVDCAARMHVCKAVCCRLDFALSIPEVESGRVKFDLGRPYFVRHTASGCCEHNDSTSGGCRIYADRPAVCRGYSCAHDARIWKDFERMTLNTEWIDAHLGPCVPRVVRAQMHFSPCRGRLVNRLEKAHD